MNPQSTAKSATVLLAWLAFVAGCETSDYVQPQRPPQPMSQSDKEALGFLASMGGAVLTSGIVETAPNANPTNVAALRGVGDGLLEASRNQAVGASGTDVVVNVNGHPAQELSRSQMSQGELRNRTALLPEYRISKLSDEFLRSPNSLALLRRRIGSLMTYRSMIDIDGDGKTSFKDFQGIKRNFQRGEQVNVAVRCFGRTPMLTSCRVDASLSVYDIDGNTIAYKEDAWELRASDSRILTLSLGKTTPPGLYTIVARYKDEKGYTVSEDKTFQVLP